VNLSPTLPTTLRQIAATIMPGDPTAEGDHGYLTDTADAIDAGTATDEDIEDAIAIAAEYQA
jgi:hypothetical protein